MYLSLYQSRSPYRPLLRWLVLLLQLVCGVSAICTPPCLAWRLRWATSIAIIHLCQTYVLVVRLCKCVYVAYLLVRAPLARQALALELVPRLDCGRIGGRAFGEEVVFVGRVVHI